MCPTGLFNHQFTEPPVSVLCICTSSIPAVALLAAISGCNVYTDSYDLIYYKTKGLSRLSANHLKGSVFYRAAD